MIFISSYIQKWGGRVERIPPDFRQDFLRPHLMPTLPTFLFLWVSVMWSADYNYSGNISNTGESV